jgi:hypothetical protein
LSLLGAALQLGVARRVAAFASGPLAAAAGRAGRPLRNFPESPIAHLVDNLYRAKHW